MIYDSKNSYLGVPRTKRKFWRSLQRLVQGSHRIHESRAKAKSSGQPPIGDAARWTNT